MKKNIVLLLTVVLILSMFLVGCNSQKENKSENVRLVENKTTYNCILY